MKLAICIKKDNDPFGYDFKLYQKYRYYLKDDGSGVVVSTMNRRGSHSYFVINDKYGYDMHCAYDQEHFDEYFINLKEYRKLKLEKLNKHNKII